MEAPPPAKQLEAVYTKNFKISSPFWNARAKALIVNWIPHCIDQINRDDLPIGQGGIDNFINAGKALRGEPHGYHKGYVFSNAWVHQTVEAMSIALMIDPQGDSDIIKAHEKFRKTLDAWIPIILAAQEPDGYLQTAFTAAAPRRGLLPPFRSPSRMALWCWRELRSRRIPMARSTPIAAAAAAARGQDQANTEQPFDGKTSTTVLFPVLNQDFTTTLTRIALTEGTAAGQRSAVEAAPECRSDHRQEDHAATIPTANPTPRLKSRRPARQSEALGSGALAAITKDTPQATSWNRPSTIT